MKALICLLAMAQVFLASTAYAAQEQDGAPKLALTSGPVKPDAPVYVNDMFSPSGTTDVFVVHQTIQFPRDKLMFYKATMGIAADLAHAEMKLDMKDASGAKVDDREAARSLDLTITGKRPLAEGPLVEFQFRVIEPKEQSIKLSQTAEALDDQGKKIAGLKVSDGEVVVKAETGPGPTPIMSCFFFSH